MPRLAMVTTRRPAALAAAFAVALLAAGPGPAIAQKMPALEPREGRSVGDRAPNVSLKGLDGRSYDLKDLRGRSVVHLLFWATWCVPCMQEIPAIHDAYARLRDRGFEVFAIVLNINQTPDGVRAVARDYRVNYPILWDGDGKATNRYRVSMIPQNFLIGKDGIIRYAGTTLPGDYETRIEALLHEAAPAAPAVPAVPAARH